MFRQLMLCALLATAVLAQPNPNQPPSIRNAANWQLGIASGSYMAISTINGLSTKLTFYLTTSDRVTVQLTPIIPPNASAITAPPGVAPTSLWFVIPPNAPSGAAFITIGDGGLSTFFTILDTAPGLFTAAYNGVGPALALNHPSTRNALTTAAVPNGVVSLFATGLNGARTADVSVELAGQPITPLYAGPQGQPGLDQINFVVPPNAVLGCYVPVSIRVRGILSNQTTLSINSDPRVCAHPLGLTYPDLLTLDAGGTVPLAQFSVGSDTTSGQAPQEGAGMALFAGDAPFVSAQSGVQTTEAQRFSCYIGTNLGAAGGVVEAIPLDAGSLIVSGPNGKQFEVQHNEIYYSSNAPSDNPPFFTQGMWRVSGTGGPTFGAFQQNFALPPALNYTNLDSSTVIPSQGYTLRWDGSGFGSGDIMSVTFNAMGDFTNYAVCSAPAWAGQLLLPSSSLEKLKGRSTIFATEVRPNTISRTLFYLPNNAAAPIRGFIDYSFRQQVTALVQ